MNETHAEALCARIVYSIEDIPDELYARHLFLADLHAKAYLENQEPPCEIGEIVGPVPGLVVHDGAGMSLGEQALGVRAVIGMSLCLYHIKTPPEAQCIEFVGWTLILEGIPFPVRAGGFMRMML